MENPMLDFEMEQSEKLKKAFYEGYEAGKKDAEFYMLHCGDTDEPQTNADRIRSMTDEELAEFMCRNVSNGTVNCTFCSAAEFCRAGHIGWLDWLKKECE